jgi:hypothetical protein
MEAAASVAAAAAVFGLLRPLTQPSVPGGDSGELLAEACQLGIAHPPGYPLFTLLAHAASRLPVGGSVAWRVNVASVALAALASGLFARAACATVELLVPVWRGRASPPGSKAVAAATAAGRAVVASAAAVSLALSPLHALYSIGAEVFVLNNFLVCAILCHAACYARGLAVRVRSGESYETLDAYVTSRTAVGAVLCGLALTNQHTSVLLIAPLALWVLVSQAPLLTARRLALYAAAFLAGLLPYAHLPLAQLRRPLPGSWGDTTSLRGFLRHLLRQDYGTFRLITRTDKPVEGFAARNAAWARDLLGAQMPAGGGVALVAGLLVCVGSLMWACWARRPPGQRRGRGSGPAGGGGAGASSSSGRAAGHALHPQLRHRKGESAVRGEARSAERDQTDAAAQDECRAGPPAAPLPAGVAWAAGAAVTFPALLPALLAAYFGVFHSLSNMPLSDPLLAGVHARFWMQPNILAFLIAAVGLAAAAEAASQWLASTAAPDTAAPTTSTTKAFSPPWGASLRLLLAGALPLAVGAGAALAGLRHFRSHAAALDHSHNRVMEAYGRALLEPLPPRAVHWKS